MTRSLSIKLEEPVKKARQELSLIIFDELSSVGAAAFLAPPTQKPAN